MKLLVSTSVVDSLTKSYVIRLPLAGFEPEHLSLRDTAQTLKKVLDTFLSIELPTVEAMRVMNTITFAASRLGFSSATKWISPSLLKYTQYINAGKQSLQLNVWIQALNPYSSKVLVNFDRSGL